MRNSSNNLIKVDFGGVPVALDMDAQVSLRDIYDTLVQKEAVSVNTKYSDWSSDKLKYYTQGIDFIDASFKNEVQHKDGHTGAVRINDHAIKVQVAMEILANGHGKVGHEMRQFMSQCVRLVNEQRQLTPDKISRA